MLPMLVANCDVMLLVMCLCPEDYNWSWRHRFCTGM